MKASFRGYFFEESGNKVIIYDSVDSWRNKTPVYTADNELEAEAWVNDRLRQTANPLNWVSRAWDELMS